MAFTGTDVMNSQQYLNLLTELNALKGNNSLAKGRLYYIGDTKAIAVANATNEYIPFYENAIGSNLSFTASTRKIAYKTPFGEDRELSLEDLTVAVGTGEIATNVAAGVPQKEDTLEMAFRRMVNNLANFEGSEHITTVGTISSGTWEGDTIAVASGGTGKTTVGKDKMLYASANNTYAEVATTSFGRGILSATTGTMVIGLHAATASKLHTKRTIWGQDFDGSANVSGPFSGATTGAFSEGVTVGGHLTVGSADGSYVQIGALRLVYDATNNAIKLLDPNTTTPKNANFYATGSVAAFGPGTISGGGGSTSGRLDREIGWTGYDDSTMATWALSAGLGYDMLLRIEDLEQNPGVSYGSATSSYVPLTVGSTLHNISLSGHTHTIANVSGLQSALDGKLNKGSYSRASSLLTGANVFSNIVVVNGIVTATATRALTKGDLSLGNVDNTSDASKPISTAVSNALAAKAPIASPTFTGTPKAPTADAATDTDQIATTAFVHNVVTSAVSSVFTYKGTATVEIIKAKVNGSTPVGHAYRLTNSGALPNATDSDKDVAAGDMVICTQSSPILWSIIQNNIDTADLESRLDTVEALLTWILPAT